MQKCSNCMQGICNFCRKGECECNHAPIDYKEKRNGGVLSHYEEDEEDDSGSSESEAVTADDKSSRKPQRQRKQKRNSALKDQQSTGRKRAAKYYPIIPDAPCEWQRQANCGGGAYPILGCYEGKQKDRHHGPEKAVTNNEPGNVHRICAGCHHTWHAANDPDYDWNAPNLTPHNPRPMTPDEEVEAAINDHRRQSQRLQRIRD